MCPKKGHAKQINEIIANSVGAEVVYERMGMKRAGNGRMQKYIKYSIGAHF
jgi:hypothetical protein